jgi:hypothetical protein
VTSEPAFFVGLLLVLTGLACAGVGAFLGRPYRLLIVGGIPFLVAGALLVSAARDRHRFRVTEVEMTAVRDYTGPCPGEHRVGIRVKTAGGAGKVAFRVWANDDLDAPLQSVSVRPNLSFEFVTQVTVTEEGWATAYAAVDSPNYVVASSGFGVTCTPGGE